MYKLIRSLDKNKSAFDLTNTAEEQIDLDSDEVTSENLSLLFYYKCNKTSKNIGLKLSFKCKK